MGGHPISNESPGRWRRQRESSGSVRWIRLLLIVLLLLVLCGALVVLVGGRPLAFTALQRITARKFPDISWIGRAELARWREDPARPQPVVLDARTEKEYDVSHLKDAARIDPYRPSLRLLKGFAKDTPIVVYSSIGYRSGRVAHWLGRQGYDNVHNLAGSIFQWGNEGRPIFKDQRPTLLVHPYDRKWGLLLDSDYRSGDELSDGEKKSAAP